MRRVYVFCVCVVLASYVNLAKARVILEGGTLFEENIPPPVQPSGKPVVRFLY